MEMDGPTGRRLLCLYAKTGDHRDFWERLQSPVPTLEVLRIALYYGDRNTELPGPVCRGTQGRHDASTPLCTFRMPFLHGHEAINWIICATQFFDWLS